MKKILILALATTALLGCKVQKLQYGSTVVIDSLTIADKIKGGWAGQTIGCTYGGPTEFKYKGGMINDSVPIVWYDNYIADIFRDDPGLFDDVYMDITFAEVMAKGGIDTPAAEYATAFANADYKLWHANQAARYNILHGIMPPASGNWLNNPHADDIDFEIESDFIGMICPGMPATSNVYADRIGHIMNYGDGWYGGVYISNMYALAFVSNDIPYIVSEALKAIPKGTKYRSCIEDVIKYHNKYPNDWRRCWEEVEIRHGYDIGCPEGVFNGFNIDAVINSAYVVMGLLYGDGDFYKTMDIATRCGQDSDCNPASAAGILGIIKGYNAIPDKWKVSVEKVMDMDFAFTTTSLNKIFAMNMKLLSDVVRTNGGSITDGKYNIVLQEPKEVVREESFKGLKPTEKRVLKLTVTDSVTLAFDGNSVVVLGNLRALSLNPNNSYVANIEAYIDGQLVETFDMPYDYIKRKYDIYYKYNLPENGKHLLHLKWLNPDPDFVIDAKEMVVYSQK